MMAEYKCNCSTKQTGAKTDNTLSREIRDNIFCCLPETVEIAYRHGGKDDGCVVMNEDIDGHWSRVIVDDAARQLVDADDEAA